MAKAKIAKAGVAQRVASMKSDKRFGGSVQEENVEETAYIVSVRKKA